MVGTIPEPIAALGGMFLNWPEDGLSFRAPSALPRGLRLSTPCPAARIIDAFLPEDTGRIEKVSKGTSLSGHLYADLFIQSDLPEGTEAEYLIPWIENDFGTSGMDAVTWDGPMAAHWEIKTSSDKNPRPSSTNRSQVIRQRAVATLAGVELPQSYIMMIGKAGNMAGFKYGPFPVHVTTQELDNAIEEIELTRLIVDDIFRDGIDAREHPLMRDLCNCTSCYPPPLEDCSEELRRRLDEEYDSRFPRYQELSKWYKAFTSDLKAATQPEQRIASGKWVAHHTKMGRLTISPRTEMSE